MTRQELVENIKRKKSFLIVGLDVDLAKIPQHLLELEDPVFEFNKQIIDATKDICVGYKPNTAFFEALGSKGWLSLERTIDYINKTSPDSFTIADAKRGDIGNTSKMYAEAFLKQMNFDSITVAPYMGEDSVTPFLSFKDKWVILLALTSNQGSKDFQLNDSSELYKTVLTTAKKWASADEMMYVVGATKAEMLTDIRATVPDSFLLIPGVGAQGGSLQEVAKYGLTKSCGLLVNSSRGIIYAGQGGDFAEKAREEALKLQSEMADILAKAGLV